MKSILKREIRRAKRWHEIAQADKIKKNPNRFVNVYYGEKGNKREHRVP